MEEISGSSRARIEREASRSIRAPIRIERRTEEPEMVDVIALYPDHAIVRNTPTGKTYESPRGGTIIQVDRRDLAHILSLQRGPTGCCGAAGQGETRYFALASE